jgi:diguanylate cyclase (GGDEF)-like protein
MSALIGGSSRGRRLAASVALAMLASVPARALDPGRSISQYRIQSWSTREGLPQSSVEAILQTRDGYLWLGTQEGLARFDGVRFVVLDKSNTKALRANRVLSLCEDRKGDLWIGTEGGGLTRMRQGGFATWREADGLPNDRVSALAEDSSGVLWVGTDRGLARASGDGFVAAGLAGLYVQSLIAAKDGTVWVGLRDGTVWPVRHEQLGEPLLLPGSGGVDALWADDDGTLWAGRRNTLVRVSPGSVRTYTGKEGLPGRSVFDIHRDRDGSLWVGTENGGLARLRGDRFEVLTTRDGLSNNMVQRILEDREGNLWVGTQDGGLNRLADGKFVTWTTREGLAADIVWPVMGDREGNLWVGTSNGGLSRFRDGRFTTLTTRDGLSSNSIQSLAQDAEGAIWVGTRGGGLNRLKDGRWTRWSTRDGLPSDSVTSLLPTRDGRLWIGLRDGGLVWMDRGRIVPIGGQSLQREIAHYIHQDRRGDVWIATNGRGVVRYSGGAFTSYTTKEGLSSDIVNVLHEDGDGTLWIGTFGGGLNRLREGWIDSWTTAQGLFDDAIFQILEDGRDHLWMSCNKGIFRVSKQELDDVARGIRRSLQPVVYGQLDGMRNQECNGANMPPGWRMADGRLFFPTIEGLVMVDPERMRTNRIAPPIALEQVRANDEPVTLAASLDFPPDRESFEFHYTALSLSVPERVRFRYKLEGLDRDWVEAGARRVAYYTRIPPGRYRFVVTAANEDGVWNEGGVSVAFRLHPHFWRTGWFFALGAVLVGATGVFGYRLRVRQLHRREGLLVRVVEERTRQLEEANRTLERLSQLDGLTGVANRRRFDEALDAEWRRGCRTGAPLSLVLLDIDAFKAFNDTYGHLRGDECLRQVAVALAGALGRAGDLVARYGGEEFAALLSGVGDEEAAVVADRLRANVQVLRIPHGASPAAGVVTVSAGVATLTPTERGDPATLVAAADQALYEAKRRGRNRVVGQGAPA